MNYCLQHDCHWIILIEQEHWLRTHFVPTFILHTLIDAIWLHFTDLQCIIDICFQYYWIHVFILIFSHQIVLPVCMLIYLSLSLIQFCYILQIFNMEFICFQHDWIHVFILICYHKILFPFLQDIWSVFYYQKRKKDNYRSEILHPRKQFISNLFRNSCTIWIKQQMVVAYGSTSCFVLIYVGSHYIIYGLLKWSVLHAFWE